MRQATMLVTDSRLLDLLRLPLGTRLVGAARDPGGVVELLLESDAFPEAEAPGRVRPVYETVEARELVFRGWGG